MIDILNIGCGNKFLASNETRRVVNHDRIKHRPEVDVTHDLNEMPWPWEDNSFDMVVACAVLEHLKPNLIESLNECWRILRPGGLLRLKVPYCKHEDSWADPTHYWQCSLKTFDFFDPDTKLGTGYAFYPTKKWKKLKVRLNKEGTSVSATLQVRKGD